MIDFPVPAEEAFDYLVDPRNRPQWQASLVRVEHVEGEPRVGQTWIDVTAPRLRPRLETTELERPRVWSERGRWQGFDAVLTLDFAEAPGGCSVGPRLRVRGRGVWAPLAPMVRALAPYVVRADLRRAADVLSRRT